MHVSVYVNKLSKILKSSDYEFQPKSSSPKHFQRDVQMIQSHNIKVPVVALCRDLRESCNSQCCVGKQGMLNKRETNKKLFEHLLAVCDQITSNEYKSRKILKARRRIVIQICSDLKEMCDAERCVSGKTSQQSSGKYSKFPEQLANSPAIPEETGSDWELRKVSEASRRPSSNDENKDERVASDVPDDDNETCSVKSLVFNIYNDYVQEKINPESCDKKRKFEVPEELLSSTTVGSANDVEQQKVCELVHFSEIEKVAVINDQTEPQKIDEPVKSVEIMEVAVAVTDNAVQQKICEPVYFAETEKSVVINDQTELQKIGEPVKCVEIMENAVTVTDNAVQQKICEPVQFIETQKPIAAVEKPQKSQDPVKKLEVCEKRTAIHENKTAPPATVVSGVVKERCNAVSKEPAKQLLDIPFKYINNEIGVRPLMSLQLPKDAIHSTSFNFSIPHKKVGNSERKILKPQRDFGAKQQKPPAPYQFKPGARENLQANKGALKRGLPQPSGALVAFSSTQCNILNNEQVATKAVQQEHVEVPPKRPKRDEFPNTVYPKDPTEVQDLISPKWNDIKRLCQPYEFFNFVQNQWNRARMPNPHEDLTKRFVTTSYVPGNNLFNVDNSQSNICCTDLFNVRINVLLNSLHSIRTQITNFPGIQHRMNENARRSRQSFLANYRSRLEKRLDKLETSKRIMVKFFNFYCDRSVGFDAMFITEHTRAQVEHNRMILDGFEDFYGYPK